MIFRKVFSPGTMMRNRCEDLVAGKPDPHPGTSGSEHVESMLRALSDGDENPYHEVALATKRRKAKFEEYPIIPRVAEALAEMFAIRKERSGA